MPPHKSRTTTKLIIIFACVAAVAVAGIALRIYDARALRDETEKSAVPTVSVISASRGPATEELVLSGNVQAWHDAPIYARINGYLKDWKSDIGTRVKKGDVLAEIDAPEVDSELRQAEADVNRAEADYKLAQSTANRWKTMLKTEAVSQQGTDEKVGDADAKKAQLASARANRDRLKDQESFTRITAPFNGTITARNTDKGALISAGSSNSAGMELFHIADNSQLRIYVQVPQTYVNRITPGMTAELHFAEHPGKIYTAKLLETADAIDPASRTLLTQFSIENKENELMAGGYTEVHLKIDTHEDSMRLPVNTLIFRADGMQVATVGEDGRVLLKPITIGRDFGNEVEVKSGVSIEEKVIINPSDSLLSGQTVNAIAAKEKKAVEEPAKDKTH